MGHGVTGFASGNFYGEPSPRVNMFAPNRIRHLGKVLFEQWWLTPPGVKRNALQVILMAGSKALGIPADI